MERWCLPTFRICLLRLATPLVAMVALLGSADAWSTIPAKVTTNTAADVFNSPTELCSNVYSWWAARPATDPNACGTVTISGGCPTWSQLNTSRTIVADFKNTTTQACPGGTYSYTQTWAAQCPANSTYNHSGGCVCNTGYSENKLGLCWKEYNPPKNANQCDGVGNPCQPATGVKHDRELLYQGRQQFPIIFGLNYLSTVPTADSRTPWTGVFGRLWVSDYEKQLRFVENSGTGIPLTVGAVRADGREWTFLRPSSGELYQTDADVTDTLTRVVGPSTIEWHYVTPDGTVEVYDSLGKLVSITTRAGQSQLLSYSDASTAPSIAPRAGLLISVTTNFGSGLTFAYDSTGRVSHMTTPDNGTFTFVYDGPSGGGANNNLTSITYPDGATKLFYYNESGYTDGASLPNHLTGIVDESGQRFATYKYFWWGGVASSEHAGGVYKFTFGYAYMGNSTVTDPLGAVRTFTLSNVLGVRKTTGVSSACTFACGTNPDKATAYDSNGNPTSKTDFNNVVTTYAYNSRNLEVSRTEAYGTPKARTITTQWHATYRFPTLITEPNRTTAYTYDSNGNQLTKTITDTATTASRTWTNTYNVLGQILTADGPRTDVADTTTYAYYSCSTGYQCGQLYTVTDALGHVTTYSTYDANGQPLTIIDPNGVTTTLTYDARQRLASRTVGSETTSFDYWPTGALKKVTLPDSSYLSYTYDAAQRLIQINDANGNKVVYTLDAMGNHIAENLYDTSNALARTHGRVFNNMNQLWKDVSASGATAQTTVFGYDNNGNRTTINAPLTRNTTNAYDELNRLKQITDPNSGNTYYGYDANNNLTSVIDPRNFTTSYQYSGLGDLKQLTSPDTGTTINTFDSAGNLATSTNANSQVATYSTDALNRVTQVTYSDQTIGYQYDQGTNGVGHLTSLSDASGSTS